MCRNIPVLEDVLTGYSRGWLTGFLEVQIHEEQRTDLKNELGSFVTVVNIPETQG